MPWTPFLTGNMPWIPLLIGNNCIPLLTGKKNFEFMSTSCFPAASQAACFYFPGLIVWSVPKVEKHPSQSSLAELIPNPFSKPKTTP